MEEIGERLIPSNPPTIPLIAPIWAKIFHKGVKISQL